MVIAVMTGCYLQEAPVSADAFVNILLAERREKRSQQLSV